MSHTDVIGHTDRFYIGGSWTEPSSDDRITVLNSATEEVFAVVAEARESDVNRAVEAARRAFDKGPWPTMSHEERAGYLRALADELDKRAERHARIWVTESGVVHSVAAARMGSIGATYRSYADLASTYPFQERHPSASGGALALLVREPVGVVGAIVPWNGTPGLITSKVAPALLAGCTVVVKSSPEAPGSAYILAEAAEAAGFPEGVINILTADRAVSEKLVAHPGVDKIAFTGSTIAGKKIGAICGGRIARQTLELGGKSPALVLDDYDIETAARTIAGRTTFLTGQVCAALTRIVVSRARHDDLVEALASEFAKVKVGDPFESSCTMGPLAMSRQRERVEGYIAKGKEEGARLAAGGNRPAHLNRGYFIEPTVFGNVDNSFTIAREEIFGPVLSVIPAESESEMIEIANDNDFGLNAAVFTNDFDKAYAVARQIRSGTVGQNGFRAEMGLSFGGFKQSGIGREGGTEGLRHYLETKVVVLDGMPSNAGRVTS